MPFECPKKIETVPESDLFSFNYTFNMKGNDTQNIDYSTKPLTFGTKPFKHDILKINKGINDPISKHWPRIETLKMKSISKKIKLFGKTFNITQSLPTLTQTVDEIYTKTETKQITFFTIPSFIFQLNSSLAWSGDIKCNFTLSVESKEVPGGVFLLATAVNGEKNQAADLIDKFYTDYKHDTTYTSITQLTDSSARTKVITNMLNDPAFLGYTSATALLTYLMRDGLTANFRIDNASGKLNWNLDKFYIEFGDLKINIPKFTIELDFNNILGTGDFAHPITVSGSPEYGLMVTVQLLSVPGGDFFKLMIAGLNSTLAAEQKLVGTSSYNEAYIKELEDICKKLGDADDSVTKWIQNYLGISYTTIISFVFCPAGMTNVPPTPFYLKFELDLNVNPYKILDELFDAAESIEKALASFENDLLKEFKEILPGFSHSVEHIIKGALNKANKELLSGTEKLQKKINNKYINKVYTPHIITYIPIEPPP